MCVAVGFPSVRAGSNIHSATARSAACCSKRGPDSGFASRKFPFSSIKTSSFTTPSVSIPFAQGGMAAGDCDTILAGIVAPWFGALPWRSLVCSGGSCLAPSPRSRASNFGAYAATTELAAAGAVAAAALFATTALVFCAPVCCRIFSAACAGVAPEMFPSGRVSTAAPGVDCAVAVCAFCLA